MRVDEHTIELASSPAFYRSAGALEAPPVYLHGLPTHSEDWTALLERTGGIAPDLIGFGRSGKAGHLDYTLTGLATWVERLLDVLGIAATTFVGHQWGAAVALELATRRPERVTKIVLVDPLPLLGTHEWTGVAGLLRRPLVGELLMGAYVKPLFARTLRKGATHPETTWSQKRVDSVWDAFDQGTQRAILRLHRATDPHHFASGRQPTQIPASVIHGRGDPWVTSAQATAYAERAGSTVTEIPDAGHWPWLDRDEAVDAIAAAVE